MGMQWFRFSAVLWVVALTAGCDSEGTNPLTEDAAVLSDAAVDMAAVDATVETDTAVTDAQVALDQDMVLVDMATIDAQVTDAAQEDVFVSTDAELLDAAVPDAEPADMVLTDMTADMGPPTCDPVLTITPERDFADAYDLITFIGGGTGQYRFNFEQNESGAILNELSGAYLAGGVQGSLDRIVMTDEGCSGSVTALVDVVSPLQLTPATAEVAIGHQFRFEPSGGSGTYVYSMVDNLTGGSVSPDGVYQAGDTAGIDVILVTDPETMLDATAEIEVLESPVFNAQSTAFFMPIGTSTELSVTGGSGHVVVTGGDDVVDYDADTRVFTAVSSGRTSLQVSDRFSGLSFTIQVDVSQSLYAPLTPFGTDEYLSHLLSPGDINGDGFPDVIMSDPRASGAYAQAGVVAIYAGEEGGLNPAPVQVFEGSQREDQFGYHVAVGDWNGDSIQDLAIGARMDDLFRPDGGAVYIHLSQPEGLFSSLPYMVLQPLRNGDRMGTRIGSCDFNGDGYEDLLVTANGYENVSRANSLRDQGLLMVFLGFRGRFARSTYPLSTAFISTQTASLCLDMDSTWVCL